MGTRPNGELRELHQTGCNKRSQPGLDFALEFSGSTLPNVSKKAYQGYYHHLIVDSGLGPGSA